MNGMAELLRFVRSSHKKTSVQLVRDTAEVLKYRKTKMI